MSTNEHRDMARSQRASCAVLTISDSRTESTDQGGGLILDKLQAAGHSIEGYEIVRDEPLRIQAQLRVWLAEPKIEVICTTGGTGISSRDTTVEVVRSLLDKELEGFGELFRMLSWDQVGAAALLSRAVAGLAGETLIFTLPGSTKAVDLAMTKLLVPELPHLVWERRR